MFWAPLLDQLELIMKIKGVKIGFFPYLTSWLIDKGWSWIVYWDLVFFLFGLIFLVDLLLQWRVGILWIFFSLLLFFVSPMVLSFCLGYGQGMFFFLLCFYIWLSEKGLKMDIKRETLLMVVAVSFVWFAFPFWAFPLISMIVFIWAVRSRLLDRSFKKVWFLMFGAIALIAISAGLFNPLLSSKGRWDIFGLSLLLYALCIPFCLGWVLAKNSIWNWAGWIYFTAWAIGSYLSGQGIPFYLLFPATVPWFLSLAVGLDKVLCKKELPGRIILGSSLFALYLFLGWIQSYDLMFRVDNTVQAKLSKSVSQFSPRKIVVSSLLRPIKMIFPKGYQRSVISIDQFDWQTKDGVLFLLSQKDWKQIEEHTRSFSIPDVEFLDFFYFLDASPTYGIIPVLRGYSLYRLGSSDEDSCSCV